MSAKQTKGRSSNGRIKKGAKMGYRGNNNASKPASKRKYPKKKKT